MTSASNGYPKPSLVINLINRTGTAQATTFAGGPHPTQIPQLRLSQLSSLQPSTPSPHLSVTSEGILANSSVPFLSANLTDSQSINVTSSTGWFSWWRSSIYANPDVLLALALIVFYAIFVLFIVVIIVRIVVTIVWTGSSFKIPVFSDGYSDTIDAETSSRTRGFSQSYSQSKSRRFFQHEMTSFAIDRTNSPSIIDEKDDES